ncbi:hypothetical protein WA026_023847 [Henosepilachna vigintioctopunctata]|uniref:Uncharacterized protein n=1 Tax=Henosepilachna vigintioctopunctata TaxID=420089 RepID=A0AAW1TWB1_9CUCU
MTIKTKSPSMTNQNKPVSVNKQLSVNKTNVKNSKNRIERKRLGTADSSQNPTFQGVQKKVWIFINRVQRNVVETNIQDYILSKEKFSEVEISVREIPGNPNGLKRFVISAPYKFKEDLYECDFWPSGVGIKRFNFNKYKEQNNGINFLDSRQTNKQIP